MDKKIYDCTSNYFVAQSVNPNRVSVVSRSTVSRASTENPENGIVHYFYRYPENDGWFDYESMVTSRRNYNKKI